MERKKELVVSTPDGVENKYMVEWPTVQQLIDVESLKLALSKGKYTEMILSGTKWMSRVLSYIDMCSYLTVMCPKLLTDMKVDPRNLDAMDANKGLMKVYREQFLPWWIEYEAIVNKFENPEPEEEESKVEETSSDSNTSKNE